VQAVTGFDSPTGWLTIDPELRDAVVGATAAAPSIVADAIAGDWKLERLLGQGGMGAVYAAVHTIIGKRAAVKVVRPGVEATAHARILREAKAVNEVCHPNIIDIFQAGMLEDGRAFLVMELLEGSTLGARLAAGPVPFAEAIDILLQICAALEAAHAAGIIHRDLKPDNIFLCDGPERLVKVVDWGIAKWCDEAPSDATADGIIFGTPRYLSPEQARNRGVDGRSDLYALGVIAYQLLLGRAPFTDTNTADLIMMHLSKPPPRPSEIDPAIDPALDTLLFTLMAKSPDQRPALPEIQDVLATFCDAVPRTRLARGSTRLESRALTEAAPEPAVEPLAELIAPPVAEPRRWLRWGIATLAVASATPPTGTRSAKPPPIPAEITASIHWSW
jgi:serine/threonine-protein kinase